MKNDKKKWALATAMCVALYGVNIKSFTKEIYTSFDVAQTDIEAEV